MTKTPTLEKRNAPKGSRNDKNEFEETFKPKKTAVNFGVSKNEKAKKATSKKANAPRKIIIILLAIILLLGAGGATLYFSGVLPQVLKSVGLSGFVVDAEATFEERQATLDHREAALDAREESLNKRENQLNAQEAKQAATPESESSPDFEEMLKSLSDEKLTEIKRVGAIYSKMDPAEAATIMGSMYDDMEISSIVYYMQPEASALMLEQMESELAASVTKIMLS